MSVYVTFYSNKVARDNMGGKLPLLGARLANRFTLAVSGAAASTTAATDDCLARIVAGEDCCFEVGAHNAAHATQSDVLLAGSVIERPVAKGQFVSVIAL